jgi:hypothetical protein
VDFTQSPPECTPDPVIVKKNQNNGVEWTSKNDGYTFTGVTIDGVTYTPASNGSGEFKDVEISSNNSKSVMTITDTVSDTNDHSYSVVYTDPNGRPGTFDPTIKNQQ